MSEKFEKLRPHMETAMALQSALSLFHWDMQTQAPKRSIPNTSKNVGILSGELYKSLINDEVKTLIYELAGEEEQKQLTDVEKAIVKDVKKEFDQFEKIPADEFQAYSELSAQAPTIWEEAKVKNDYSIFAGTLDQLIAYQRKFADYRKKEGQKRYDVLLNDYEEGFTMEVLDEFFGTLKESILPLIKLIKEKGTPIDDQFMYVSYPTQKQKEFSKFIAHYVGFKEEFGVMAESAHPFTLQMHNKDVRITNHYLENNLQSAIFSQIHESGHGIYEMGVADDLSMTPVGRGTSMGVHESQSRFFENMLARRSSFWTPIYQKLVDLFPEQLGEVSLDAFVRAINKSTPGLIRTEADELTYCVHVMIRYEIEKMIFEEEVKTEDLMQIWDDKYESYLGIRAEKVSEGVLQDVHWSQGSFGYFPSYALGSAISAQIYACMEQQMDLDELLKKGDFEKIVAFLRKHIHQYGATKNTSQLLNGMMGEEFNPTYYVKYLEEKFRRIYDLQ